MRGDGLSDALYLGILQRTASPRERKALDYELLRHGDVAAVIDDMVMSEEFALMRLPHLMANASRGWCGRYLFFMHVPKTAGTSFRLALTHSAGLPAVTTYRHIGELDRTEFDRISFWPLFIGHGHIDYFPSQHRGLTVVREPRSRYLSMYRWSQNEGRGPHLMDPAVRSRIDSTSKAALQLTFGDWLRAGPRQSAASYFASGSPVQAERFVRTAPDAEVHAAVSRGAARIDHAAWAHDRDGMITAIREATGDPEPQLPELNDFKPRKENALQRIDARDLADLDDCVRRDRLLIDALVARGVLPPLAPTTADALFEATVSRLGFSLS